MNLFNRSEPAAEPEINSTTILRQAVRARSRTRNALSVMAREVGAGVAAIENFSLGQANLSSEVLVKLAAFLYPHSELNLESGLLQPLNRAPPRPLAADYKSDPVPVSSPVEYRGLVVGTPGKKMIPRPGFHGAPPIEAKVPDARREPFVRLSQKDGVRARSQHLGRLADGKAAAR